MINRDERSINPAVYAAMEETSRVTRLTDWGETEFLVPLSRLIESFIEQYRQDQKKGIQFQSTIKALLANRLFIQDTLKKHPEIEATLISRPIFVIGLARTGSTLLHRLISEDENCRILLYWEMLYPFTSTHMGLNNPKTSIEIANMRLKEMYNSIPNLHHFHETGAELPEECMMLLRHTFCSMSIVSEWQLSDFGRWFIEQDLTPSYRYYKKLLQILMWHQPKQFMALKCPSHLINLNAILNVFPDANFVWVHRHPNEAIPSFFSLLSAFWRNQISDSSFKDLVIEYSVQSAETGMNMQEKIPGNQFINISYKQLVKHPVDTVREIYTKFGYSFSSQLEENIGKFVQESPQHKHGVHKYNLEKFGLDKAEIDTRFSKYMKEYETFFV